MNERFHINPYQASVSTRPYAYTYLQSPKFWHSYAYAKRVQQQTVILKVALNWSFKHSFSFQSDLPKSEIKFHLTAFNNENKLKLIIKIYQISSCPNSIKSTSTKKKVGTSSKVTGKV